MTVLQKFDDWKKVKDRFDAECRRFVKILIELQKSLCSTCDVEKCNVKEPLIESLTSAPMESLPAIVEIIKSLDAHILEELALTSLVLLSSKDVI